MLKKLLKLSRRREYIAYPAAWEERGARVKVRAWSLAGAKIKAYRHLGVENMIDIVVREYEQ